MNLAFGYEGYFFDLTSLLYFKAENSSPFFDFDAKKPEI